MLTVHRKGLGGGRRLLLRDRRDQGDPGDGLRPAQPAPAAVHDGKGVGAAPRALLMPPGRSSGARVPVASALPPSRGRYRRPAGGALRLPRHGARRPAALRAELPPDPRRARRARLRRSRPAPTGPAAMVVVNLTRSRAENLGNFARGLDILPPGRHAWWSPAPRATASTASPGQVARQIPARRRLRQGARPGLLAGPARDPARRQSRPGRATPSRARTPTAI